MDPSSTTFEFVPAAHAVSDWRFSPVRPGPTPEESEYGRARNHPIYINQHERKQRKLNAQPGAILKIVATLEGSAGPEYEIKPSAPHLSGASFFRVPLTDRGIGECVRARITLEARRGQQPPKKAVAIFSSPLERAIQTAILATPFEDLKQCGFTIVLLPQLQECVRHPCDVVSSGRIIKEQVEIVYNLHLAILAAEGRTADAEALRAKGGIAVDFSRMGWRYEREHGRTGKAGDSDAQSFGGRARRPCEVVTETADMVLNRAWALRRFLATVAACGASPTRFLLYTHAAMIPLLTGCDVPVPGCLAPLEMAMDWESVEARKYTFLKVNAAAAAADVPIGIRPSAVATGSVAAERMVLADARAVELAKATARREAIVLLNEREAEGYEPRLARSKKAFIHAMGRTAYVRQPQKQAKVARAARREKQRQQDSGRAAGEVTPPAGEDYFPTCCASEVWNREAAAEGYRATFEKDVNTGDWPIETELRERDVW